MKVGIHIDRYKKFNSFIKKYEDILEFNNVEVKRLFINDPDFWQTVKTLDAFIFRWGHYDWDRQLSKTILPIIEYHLNIKCYPNQATCWHYDDKIRQYYLLRQYDYPFIESFIFWDKESALEWAKTAPIPIVFKLTGGAGSRNVNLLKTRSEIIRKINIMFGSGIMPENIYRNKFSIIGEVKHIGGNILRKLKGEDPSPTWIKQKNYVYFQKYLPDNTHDTRVTVIGDRAFGFIRRVRRNDFTASGSGTIEYNMSEIDLRCIEIAFEVSNKMGFQSMAYDFIMNEKNEPEFCEISYTYQDDAVYKCLGYWDSNLQWHKGHYLPQYFHLVDLLGIEKLKHPDIIKW